MTRSSRSRPRSPTARRRPARSCPRANACCRRIAAPRRERPAGSRANASARPPTPTTQTSPRPRRPRCASAIRLPPTRACGSRSRAAWSISRAVPATPRWCRRWRRLRAPGRTSSRRSRSFASMAQPARRTGCAPRRRPRRADAGAFSRRRAAPRRLSAPSGGRSEATGGPTSVAAGPPPRRLSAPSGGRSEATWGPTFQSPTLPRPALIAERMLLPSSRRCFEP